MKKVLNLLLIPILSFVISCNENVNESSLDNKESSSVDFKESSNESSSIDLKNNKSIVVYFSCTNTTKSIATKISFSLNSPIFEIIPSIPYTSADLNYSNNNCRANIEQNDPSARPEIENQMDFETYDYIFVGYPIWWGKLPKIIYTFFETYDFENKNIIPFCTSGSSGIVTSVNEIKELEPLSNVNEGRRFASSTSQDEINSWIDSLNIKN